MVAVFFAGSHLHIKTLGRALVDRHVQITRRDQSQPGPHLIAVFRFADFQRGYGIQPLRERPAEILGNVLNDANPRHVPRQLHEHIAQRLGAAGGSSEQDHLLRVIFDHTFRKPRWCWARGTRWGLQAGNWGAFGRPLIGICRRHDFGNQLGTGLGAENIRREFHHDIHCASLERAKRKAASGFRLRRHGHHRHRMLLHQDFEKSDAVHLWHLGVEGHHIGLEFENLVACHVGIRGGAHDFDPGIRAQKLGDRFAVHHRVIHHQHLDFSLRHMRRN